MAERRCPIWAGYLLANPLRKLIESPAGILNPHVRSGMSVLDVGCAMGFFSIPMARMVGPTGQVVCVDVQQKMIDSLKKRARKAGLSGIIHARRCDDCSLGVADLDGTMDFVLAYAVIHEVSDPGRLLGEISGSLKPGGKMLLVEPKGHVSRDAFEETLNLAVVNDLQVADRPRLSGRYAALLQKPQGT